jgi:hypothetical protein
VINFFLFYLATPFQGKIKFMAVFIRLLGLVWILLASIQLQAQRTNLLVRGQVKVADDHIVLQRATIYNMYNESATFTDQGGFFTIMAAPGDSIRISNVGYETQFLVVPAQLPMQGFVIALNRASMRIATIEVEGKYNPYQLDSMQRYEDHQVFLKQKTKAGARVKQGTTEGGIAFSPITFFSKKQRDLRKFKTDFDKFEKQAYVDYRFNKEFVSRVSGLTSSELLQFMKHYQLNYEQARSFTNQGDLIYWITARANAWKAQPRTFLKFDE